MQIENSVKMKQYAQLNQKSKNRQSSLSNSNDALSQSSFGKMVSGTETSE